jgi:alpha-amylase
MARADERGDFVNGDFSVAERPSGGAATLSLVRAGEVRTASGATDVELAKRFELSRDGSCLSIRFDLTARGSLATAFGSEFNLAMLSGSSHDRFYYLENGRKIGPLGLTEERPPSGFLGLVDEWQGVKIEFRFSPSASLYLLPVETVSQSEGGFELLYQQSCVIPWWPVSLEGGENFVAQVDLTFRFEH